MWIKIPKELITGEESMLVNIESDKCSQIHYSGDNFSQYLVIKNYLTLPVDSKVDYEILLDYIFEQCNNNHNELK